MKILDLCCRRRFLVAGVFLQVTVGKTLRSFAQLPLDGARELTELRVALHTNQSPPYISTL